MFEINDLTAGQKIRFIKGIQNRFHLTPSGEYDDHTKAGVKNFQLRMNIPSTGLLDDPTVKVLKTRFPELAEHFEAEEVSNEGYLTDEIDATTDRSEVESDLVVHDKILPSDEYVNEKTPKKYLFIHHTSGWNNPYNVVDDWANDTRGRIGTHYIIGGINIKTGDTQYDGEIVKAIPEDCWANHLGGFQTHGISSQMHKQSIGIELCNFGYLTKRGSNFITYTGAICPKEFVVDLGVPFRGYQYWHKYTDLQLHSLEFLLRRLGEKYEIDLERGLKQRLLISKRDAFNTFDDAKAGKVPGLLSHTSVRKDKTDCSPQPNLISMISGL